MIVKFDALNRMEVPKLTLCNPGCEYVNGKLTNAIGILTDHEAEEIVFNFNALSELNFRINKVTRGTEDDEFIHNLYDSVQNRRLIYVEDIGFFSISDMTDGYSNGVYYKDVKAQSCESEIQQKMIPFIDDGTYRFSTGGSSKGLLDSLVETIPFWSIGYVDAAIANRYRTFEDVDVTLNCLGFMLDKMQDAYECIFLFDIKNRLINVYDQGNYVVRTSIHLTKEDLINSIDITENADDLYTALTAVGSNDETISAINPIGSNTLYNFSYYLDWMTLSLKSKVSEWQSLVNSYVDSYYNLNLQYYSLLNQKSNLQAEVDRIDGQITMHNRCKDNLIANSGDKAIVQQYNKVIVENGGDPISITKDVNAIVKDIESRIKEYTTAKTTTTTSLRNVETSISNQKSKIDAIHDTLNFSKYFTAQQLQELENYIFEGSYTDEYIVITDDMDFNERFEQMKLMYDRTKEQLRKASMPTQEFRVDVENFIFEKNFKDFSSQLETGCLINVELKEGDVAPLFLSSMTINYDDKSLSMTFGNRYNKFDAKSLFDKMLGGISKTANSLNALKDIIRPVKEGGVDYVAEAFRVSRNLTMEAALAAENQTVVIDGSGYTGRKLLPNGEFDPKQVKLTSNSMVFTDDAWNTCKTAVGEILIGDTSVYGINAEVLIGDMVITKDLRVVNDSGTVSIDKDGIKITNGSISWGTLPSDVASKTDISNLSDSLTSSVSKTYVGMKTIYYKTNGSKPSAPTTEVTSTSTNAGAWRAVVPSYTENYVIYTCNQMKAKDGTLTCTPVCEYISGAITTEITKDTVTTAYVNTLGVTAVNIAADSVISNKITCSNISITGGSISWSTLTGKPDLATKSDIPSDSYITNITKNSVTSELIKGLNLEVGNQIKMGSNATISWDSVTGKPTNLATTSQIPSVSNLYTSMKTIYYKTNGSAPSAPTTEVTSTSANSGAWRVVVPSHTDGYKIYTCNQMKTKDGTLTCTPVCEYLSSAIATKITKDTIDVDYVNTLGVTAKYLSADLTITNKLQATTGSIAGWTINSTDIYKSTGSTSAGISTSANWAFYAGYSNNSAPFHVTHSGTVYCSDISITGGNVSLAGSSPGDGRLSVSYGNLYTAHGAAGLVICNYDNKSESTMSPTNSTYYAGNGTSRARRTYCGLMAGQTDYNGYIWVGTYDSDNGIDLDYDGNRKGRATNGWTTFSDIRLKDVTERLSEYEASALLNNVFPINYRWKKDKNTSIHSGFSAQEIRDVLKEYNIGYRSYLDIDKNGVEQAAVYDLDVDEDTVVYGLDYSSLTTILWKGWQMHEARIKELEDKIKSLSE